MNDWLFFIIGTGAFALFVRLLPYDEIPEESDD